MIIDRLENLAEYVSFNSLFAEVVDYLQHHDLLHSEIGKTELKGQDLSVSIAQTSPKTKEEAKLEAHRKFIDVQIPLSGTEVMGYTPVASCQSAVTPYDEEKDLLFFEGLAQSYVTVEPGMFVVFFPQDGHAPGITSVGVKKVVIKVKA